MGNELIIDIFAYVILGHVLVLAILFVIYTIIAEIKTNELQNEYIKSLNEHDKSIIATYKATKYALLKRKKKNDTH